MKLLRHGQKVLFKSEDELYHMAIGQEIVSAFNGPADLNSFDLVTHKISTTTIVPPVSAKKRKLEQLYAQIRQFREGTNTTVSRHKVFEEVKANHPKDWLLCVELYELAKTNGDHHFAEEIVHHLTQVKQDNPKVGHLIDDGIALVDKSLVV